MLQEQRICVRQDVCFSPQVSTWEHFYTVRKSITLVFKNQYFNMMVETSLVVFPWPGRVGKEDMVIVCASVLVLAYLHRQ